MSYYIQEDGRKFFAEMIAGSGLKLDTMYVEYGPGAVRDPGKRDTEYFETLRKSADSGVVKTHVANSYVDGSCIVHFTCMVRLDDLRLHGVEGAPLGCVTLAHADDHGDILVCTFSLPDDIKLIPGAYTTIRCSIDMGLGK